MNVLQKEWELLQVLQSRVELGGDFTIRYQPKLCRVSEADQLVLLSKFQKLGILSGNFPQIGKPIKLTVGLGEFIEKGKMRTSDPFAGWWTLKVNRKSFEAHYARIGEEHERYVLAYEDRQKSIAKARATRVAEPTRGILTSRSQYPLVDKLDDFNRRIQSTDEDGNFTRKTVEIVGIEFFDFVQSQQVLRDEFDRRASYFGNLIEDSTYLAVDQRLRQPVTDLCSLFKGEKGQTLLEEVQSRFSNRLINHTMEGNEDSLTLPEYLSILCSGRGLKKLGDQTPISFGKALSRTGDAILIRTQARMIGVIIQNILAHLPKDSGVEDSISDIQRRFGAAQSELEGLFYADPVRLHIKEFQRIFQIACQAIKRTGETLTYQIFSERSLDAQRTKVDFDTVIKDLTFHLRVKEADQKLKSANSGINFLEEGKFLKVLYAGRTAQFPLNEQQTHILRFTLLKIQLENYEKKTAITHSDAWQAVVDASDVYSLKNRGKNKAGREIAKSVRRHLKAIEKRLHRELAISSNVQIFKPVRGGFLLML